MSIFETDDRKAKINGLYGRLRSLEAQAAEVRGLIEAESKELPAEDKAVADAAVASVVADVAAELAKQPPVVEPVKSPVVVAEKE